MRHKSRRIPNNKMASIVVDEKQGTRELNPNYKVFRPREDGFGSDYDLESPLCRALINSFQNRPNKELFGSHKNPKDPYEWITSEQFMNKFLEFGSGLDQVLGIKVGSGSKVGIYSINCVEWMIAHYGILMYSNIAVPLYGTLGEEAMVHIMNLTKMCACICFNEEKAQNLMDTLAKAGELGAKVIDDLEALILMHVVSEESFKNLKIVYPKMKIMTMSEIQESCKGKPLPPRLPRDEDLYIINFTSGTTSAPKGVLITCKMVKRVIHSMFLTKPITRFVQDDEVYLSFLPLAHILEQVVMVFTIFMGGRAGFYSGDINKIFADFQVLKPTFLVLVPRLLIRIHDMGLARLKYSRWLIKYAVKSKIAAISRKKRSNCRTIWDWLLFDQIKSVLGGRVEVILTGSAACPPEVLDFTRAAFGATLMIGYGATETCGPLTITFTEETDSRHVGSPIEGIQIKLGDVPDMNLFPSKINGQGRGEVCAKAGNCTKGYFEDPIKTRDLIDSDGWLHTGDIGEWDKFGHLRIVDRCKNIFKLCQGEYIAPDKVENIYLTCSLVEQVFLDGRSDQSYAIAVVHPNVSALKERFSTKQAKKGEIVVSDEMSLEEICNSAQIRNQILSEMNSVAREHNLAGFEMAKKLLLISEPMTVDNGMITSTLKMVRAAVRNAYQKKFDELYATSL